MTNAFVDFVVDLPMKNGDIVHQIWEPRKPRFKEFLSPQDVLQEAVLLASSMKNLLHGAWRTLFWQKCDLVWRKSRLNGFAEGKIYKETWILP